MQEIKKGWKKVKFKDIVSILGDGLHGTPKYSDDGEYFFINGNNLVDGKIIIKPETKKTDFEEYNKYKKKLNNKTILVSINGTLGNVAFYNNEKCFLGKSACYFNVSDGIDKKFIKYVLLDNKFQIYIKNFANGSTIKNVSLQTMRDFSFFIPPLPVQQKIASILSKYDDLIENNNKRIKILEEMVQSIYEEWFVKYNFPGSENIKTVDSGNDDFGMIPEGWDVKKVGDIINIPKGKNITKATVKEGIVPVVAGGLSPSCYHNISNTIGPVITISASGANSGYVNFYYDDIWASDCSYIDSKVTNFVYFWYLQLINRQIQITGLQRGSAQPHVYPKDIMGLLSLDIPENLLSDFENIVSKIFMEIGNIKKQNQNLKETRDLLIPRLVSGELDVESLDVKL